MKNNKFLLIALGVLASFMLASCDEDTEGVTGITYYPVLELDGETYMIVDKGTAYEEPGYTATLNGEDVTDQVTVTSTVDTSTSGVYSVTYSITNEDGFASTSSRTVVVLDANDPVEGIYDTDPACYRLYNGNQTAYSYSFEILVIGEGDGVYYVEDLLGGWYCQRAGYGTNYAMEGYIYVSDGTVELLDSYVPGWGDTAEFMSDGTWDEETGTLSWMIEYTTYPMDFYVTMYKR